MVRVLKTELKQLILNDKRAYYDERMTKGDILGPAQQWITKMTYKWPVWKQALLIAFGMLMLLVFVAVATKENVGRGA